MIKLTKGPKGFLAEGFRTNLNAKCNSCNISSHSPSIFLAIGISVLNWVFTATPPMQSGSSSTSLLLYAEATVLSADHTEVFQFSIRKFLAILPNRQYEID